MDTLNKQIRELTLDTIAQSNVRGSEAYMHACEELVLAHKSSNSGSYKSLVNTHSPWVCIITNHTGGSPMLATTDATMMDRYPYNWVWYKKTARKGVCSVCAAGSFSNTTASASCKLCPRGKFQPAPKSLSLRRVSIQKPSSQISQLSSRQNDVILPDTNL